MDSINSTINVDAGANHIYKIRRLYVPVFFFEIHISNIICANIELLKNIQGNIVNNRTSPNVRYMLINLVNSCATLNRVYNRLSHRRHRLQHKAHSRNCAHNLLQSSSLAEIAQRNLVHVA